MITDTVQLEWLFLFELGTVENQVATHTQYRVVRITSYDERYGCFLVETIQTLGWAFDPEAEKQYFLACHGLLWSPISTKKLLSLSKDDPMVLIRRDLRELDTVSIDPLGCRDIDDAISFHQYDSGVIEISVSIADVSSYLHILESRSEDLEKDLLTRTSSFYGDCTQHMLPTELSENQCSLLPSEDRRAITISFRYDPDGNETVSVFHSLIRNKQAYSYEEYPTDTPLYFFTTKCSNDPVTFDTHHLVEYWMVKSNLYIGEALAKYCPSLVPYRIQEAPADILTHPEPEIEALINKFHQESAEYRFGSVNIGHHATGFKKYLHFTSPIRRYADILVHRLVSLMIQGTRKDTLTISPYELWWVEWNLNQRQQLYKKAYIGLNWLKILPNITTETTFVGYVIGFTDWTAHIVIPDLSNSLITVPLLPSHASLVVETDNTHFKLISDSNQLEIKLGDRIEILLLTNIYDPNPKHRLLKRIVSPDPIGLLLDGNFI